MNREQIAGLLAEAMGRWHRCIIGSHEDPCPNCWERALVCADALETELVMGAGHDEPDPG